MRWKHEEKQETKVTLYIYRVECSNNTEKIRKQRPSYITLKSVRINMLEIMAKYVSLRF